MKPSLAVLEEELEALSRHFQAGLDPFGTLAFYLEGAPGGATALVWAPWEKGPEVLRTLADLSFRGRALVALAPEAGDATPFTALVRHHRPRYALLLTPGEGLFHRFPGFKEVEAGEEVERVPLDDPRPARVVSRTAPTGLRYREVRTFPAWESPALDGARATAEAPLGAAALAEGALPYGVGEGKLSSSLKRALSALGLLREG